LGPFSAKALIGRVYASASETTSLAENALLKATAERAIEQLGRALPCPAHWPGCLVRKNVSRMAPKAGAP
jgi:hypothetical protein